MNILPQKSWHVRTKENINKVRRDEAKAAAEEKERKRKQEIAESESRLNSLKARAGTSTKNIDFEDDDDDDDKHHQHHVNLFDKEERGVVDGSKNQERENEKKKEKEEHEKKIGLLKYLADKEELDLKRQPWYKSLRRDDTHDDEPEKDAKRKRQQDPMKLVDDIMKEKYKKQRHHKQHKSSKQTAEVLKRPKTIEELRAERLKREGEERLKAEMLLASRNIGGAKPKPAVPQVELDDRKRKYNSQFNPELSRF